MRIEGNIYEEVESGSKDILLVNVKPHLTKPKELIPSSIIKHAYPEEWATQFLPQ